MDDYTLVEVFETVYRQEFSEFDNPPKHFFSRRHRKAMKEILYPQITSMSVADRNIPLKKRIIIVLLVILLSALGITAAADFTRKEHRYYTERLTVNAENSPKDIEKFYYLPGPPKEGYDIIEMASNDVWSVTTSYTNHETKRSIVLYQAVKKGYRGHFDNEHHPMEEVDINGHYGLYLDYSDNNWGVVIWDNGDYVLKLSGDFNKDELLDLAKSAKFDDF